MSGNVRGFSLDNPFSYGDLVELCTGPDEPSISFLKSGLLGDKNGICEDCNKGNVSLTKKEIQVEVA